MRSNFARRLFLTGALLAFAAPAAAQATMADVIRGTTENFAKLTRPLRSYTVEHETLGQRGTVHVEFDAGDAENPLRIFAPPAAEGEMGGEMAAYADWIIYIPLAIAESPEELDGAELLGVRAVEGRSAYALRLDLSEDGPGSEDAVLYLDSADYRPVRVELGGVFPESPTSRLTVDLTDYRPVGGFPIPFRRTLRISEAMGMFNMGSSKEVLAVAGQARARLAELPKEQRAETERWIRLLEDVARTNTFTLTTTVLDARVNVPRPDGLVAVEF